jgi:hypothetical protein
MDAFYCAMAYCNNIALINMCIYINFITSGIKVNCMEKKNIITHLSEEGQIMSLLEAITILTKGPFCIGQERGK